MSIIIYILVLCYLVSYYRKLSGVDAKSLEYQNKVDERAKRSTLVPSRKDHARILLMAIVADVALIIFSVLKETHILK